VCVLVLGANNIPASSASLETSSFIVVLVDTDDEEVLELVDVVGAV